MRFFYYRIHPWWTHAPLSFQRTDATKEASKEYVLIKKSNIEAATIFRRQTAARRLFGHSFKHDLYIDTFCNLLVLKEVVVQGRRRFIENQSLAGVYLHQGCATAVAQL